jgi:hypothetical protein
MSRGMPKDQVPKSHLGVYARLALSEKENERAVLDAMRCLSGAAQAAYQHLPEGKTHEELEGKPSS